MAVVTHPNFDFTKKNQILSDSAKFFLLFVISILVHFEQTDQFWELNALNCGF